MTAKRSKKTKSPPRGKWPLFHTLETGKHFDAEVMHHSALRTKATRIGKALKRKFTVRKELADKKTGREVIRVYRQS